MKSHPLTNRKLFGYGTLIGSVALSIAIASVPIRNRITDDTAIYQKMSEIRVSREATPNFDADIQRLSAIEPRYREKLPLSKNPRLEAPLKRISSKHYRFTGSSR